MGCRAGFLFLSFISSATTRTFRRGFANSSLKPFALPIRRRFCHSFSVLLPSRTSISWISILVNPANLLLLTGGAIFLVICVSFFCFFFLLLPEIGKKRWIGKMENGGEKQKEGASYTYWVREATADAAPLPVPRKLTPEDIVCNQTQQATLGSVWNKVRFSLLIWNQVICIEW